MVRTGVRTGGLIGLSDGRHGGVGTRTAGVSGRWGQLAWLTVDMLKSGTRTAGMIERVK
jgi:hypothetical protein